MAIEKSKEQLNMPLLLQPPENASTKESDTKESDTKDISAATPGVEEIKPILKKIDKYEKEREAAGEGPSLLTQTSVQSDPGSTKLTAKGKFRVFLKGTS